MKTYARWIVTHPRLIVAGVALVTLVLGVGARRLHVEVDPDKQLPQDHPYIQALNEVHRVFGDKNLIVVGLFPKDRRVFTPAFLAKLAETTRRLGEIEGANPALLQSLASPHAKVVTGTPEQIEIERVMEEPPVDQAGADAVRARAFANDAYVGTLVSADGEAAAIHASFDLGARYPDHRSLLRAVESVLHEADDGTFVYRLSGPVTFFGQLSAYSSRMAYLFPLALLVIGLVHYDAFRTLQGLFLPLLTAVLAVVWSLGLMGFLGVWLDPLNTTTAILILAVAAGHAVQVLKRFYEEYERTRDVHEAVIGCLERVGPVMLAAGTVAILSFWSLATFGTASVRTFGLFTGLGIASALAVEMTMIPALRVLLPVPKRREREREAAAHPVIDRLLRGAFVLASERRGALAAGMAAFLVAAGVCASRLHIDTSVKREFRRGDTVRVDDDAINARFAGTNTLIVLVKGRTDGALEDPRIVAAIDGLQRALAQDPSVGRAYSYVDVLRQTHAVFTAGDASGGRLPASTDLVAQYLLLHSLQGSDGLDALLDPSHRIAKVRILVRDDSTHHGEELIARSRRFIDESFPPDYDVEFTGSLASSAATTDAMVHGKLRNIVQIALVSVVVSGLLLRSLLGGVLVVVPLALTVLANFAVMGLLGIPLDMVTGAISAMAVGIGADYAMYLLFRMREECAQRDDVLGAVRTAIRTSGKAIVFVSTAVAVGYATLCVSGFGVHVQLGSLVAIAMVVSASSALVLLPAIVLAARPSFVVGRGDERRARGIVLEPTPAWATAAGRPVSDRSDAPAREAR